MRKIVTLFSIFTVLLVLLSLSPSAHATQAYIPDSQLIAINCSYNQYTICEDTFHMPDTIWNIGIYDCTDYASCNQSRPMYNHFSLSAEHLAQEFYNVFVMGMQDSTHTNFSMSCTYSTDNSGKPYYGCLISWNVLDSNTGAVLRTESNNFGVVSLIKYTCPNNGTYVYGLGCPTNSYTNSSGQTVTTDRTLPQSSFCISCMLSSLAGDVAPPYPASNPKRGDPVNVATRAVVENKTDMSFPLLFARNYSSKRTSYSMIGGGWKSNFDKTLTITNGKDSSGQFAATLDFVEENDEEIIFTRSSSGSNFALLYQDQVGFTVTYDSGNYFLRTPQGNIEVYNQNGYLVQINFANGQVYVIARNSLNQIVSVTNNFGQFLNFTYSNYANILTQITASNGDVYAFNYNNGMLTSVVFNNLPAVSYQYSGMLLTSIADEINQNYASFSYNNNGEAIQNARMLGGSPIEEHDYSYTSSGINETQPNGNTVTYYTQQPAYQNKITYYYEGNSRYYTLSYDSNGNISQYQSPSGGTYQYFYDQATNLLTSTQKPDGTTATVTWDTFNRVPLSIVEAGAGGTKTTTFAYDQYLNITSKTISGAGGTRTWSYTYAPGGLITSQTNPDGTGFSYSYYGMSDNINLRGLIHTVQNSLGQTMTFNSYDIHGYPTSITGFNGITKTFSYDAKGRALSETVGNATNTYAYNDAGDLLQANFANGYQLNMIYDLAHRLTGISDNHGGSESFTLDNTTSIATNKSVYQGSNLVSVRNKILDVLGRTTKSWGTNSSASYNYNYRGDDSVSSYSDPNGFSGNQSVNNMGRTTGFSTPEYQVGYALDAAGNPVTANVGSSNTSSTMAYNVFNEMTQLVSPDTGTHSYSYDMVGRTTTHIDNAGVSHVVSYDGLRRATGVVHSGPSSSLNESFTYNSLNTLDTISDASGSVHYGYDTLGNLTSISQTTGASTFGISYTYDNANQVTSMTYPSGLVVNYTYDNGLLVGINTNKGNLVGNISYHSLLKRPVAWSLGGASVSLNYTTDDFISGLTDNTMNQAISTDNIGQVTSVSDGPNNYSLSANYTSNHQINTGSINGNGFNYYFNSTNLYGKTDTDGQFQYSYNNGTNVMKQVVTIPAYQYLNVTSDANGNVTSDNVGSYAYDIKNNMINASTGNGTGNYAYNALKQRVAKTANGVTTIFVYNEKNQLIGEYDGNGYLIAEHIYFGSRPVGVYKNGQLYTVHTDYLGTPRVITSQNNTVVWQWLNLNVFGSNQPSIANIEYNLRFAGQYYDNESGLHYNMNRMYNPRTGRYMQSDPLGLVAGPNTFNYVNGSPLNATDPLGLLTRLLIDEGFGLGIGHVALEINGVTYGLYPGGNLNYFQMAFGSGTPGDLQAQSIQNFQIEYNIKDRENIHAFTLDISESEEQALLKSLQEDVARSKAGQMTYQGMPSSSDNCTSYVWRKLNRYTKIFSDDNPLFPWVMRTNFQIRYWRHQLGGNTGVTGYEVLTPNNLGY